MPIATFAFVLLGTVARRLYDAASILPEAPIPRLLWRGGMRAAGAVWRVVFMGFAVFAAPVLLFCVAECAFMLICANLEDRALIFGMVLILIAAQVGASVRRIPYASLAFAGLALEIFDRERNE